jgi:hypothetical protein
MILTHHDSPCSEGSNLWFHKQLVSARASRFTIGDETSITFRKDLEDHRSREGKKRVDAEYVRLHIVVDSTANSCHLVVRQESAANSKFGFARCVVQWPVIRTRS